MAIDFGRAARGIATGYLSAKVADTAAQDELNRDFILQARNQYFNVDKPNFIADEKKRSANISYIATELSPVYANYADAKNITLNDVNSRDFVDSVTNLSNEDKFKLESTITQRKRERTKTFDENNAFITEQFNNLKGGFGSMNMTKMFFPNEGEDIAEVGVKQMTTASIPSLKEIQGGGTVYNFDDHRVPRNNASNFFTGFFVDDLRRPSITFAKNTPQAVLMNELLKGYDEAVAGGFNKGKYEYARLKYIDQELQREGITGFPTGFPTVEEVKTEVTQDTKAVPQDGKKFDTTDTSQIGVTEKVEPIAAGEAVTTGAATASSSTLINDFRDFRAKINDSPSLSEDEKIKKIEQAKERVINRLTELGTFNESILRQL